MSNFHNRFKILQKIGEGSFSEVLKCQNRETGHYFAAKRLKKSFKSKEALANCAEIIAAKKIPHHQNILNLLEYHYENLTGKAILIFELMDMSMYDLLKNRARRLPELRVKFYLYQILKGLSHLQNHGLFHRDVKPENILISVTDMGELIKLGDLGSVRGIYSEPPYTEYISTRWYRSPECLLTAGDYGPKMDIWATGCVFYEMLTLKPLFPGSNEVDQLHQIHKILGPPSDKLLEKIKKKSRNCTSFPDNSGTGLFPLMSNFSENARRILKLMLEYDPDKRINARRLLQNVYFDSLRFREARSKDLPYLSRVKVDKCSKNSGDAKKSGNPSSVLEKRSLHSRIDRKLLSTDVRQRESTSTKKSTLNVSKTLLDVTAQLTGNKKNTKLKEEGSRGSKSPKIWNAKPLPLNQSADKTKQIKNTSERYRKTTSNLVHFSQPLITPGEIAENKHFQSKSFVHPQKRIMRKQSHNQRTDQTNSQIQEEGQHERTPKVTNRMKFL